MNMEDVNIVRICKKKPEIEDVKIPRYTALEYKQQMMASIRLYKYLDLSIKKNMRTPPFLFRNLLYVQCERKKVPQFILGIDEPPLAFRRFVSKQKAIPLEEKRKRLENITSNLLQLAERLKETTSEEDDTESSCTEKTSETSRESSHQSEHCSTQAKRRIRKPDSINNGPNNKRSKCMSRLSNDDQLNADLENINKTVRSDDISLTEEMKSKRALQPSQEVNRRISSLEDMNQERKKMTSKKNYKMSFDGKEKKLEVKKESSEEGRHDADATLCEETLSMNQNNSLHPKKSESRFLHPFELKTRRGKRHFRLSVYSYLGKYPKEDGVYVNANKYVKDYFSRKFLNRKDLAERLKKIFPTYCPQKLNYRMIGVDVDTEDNKDNYRRDSQKYTERYFFDSDEKEWVTFCQTKSVKKCIICQRSFSTFYSLLFHYNANYPRLKFTLFMPKTVDHIEDLTQIDISLNPYCHESIENYTSSTEEMSYQSFFLVTQHHRFLLKTQVHMDLTIFTDSLPTTDVTPMFKIPRLIICTRTGLPGGRTHSEEHPNHIPDRSFEFLTNYLNRSILDFTDVDEESKEYMCYWNDIGYIMGRELQTKLGLYFRLRIFVNKYGVRIINNKLQTAFFCHMKHLVNKNFIESSLVYDIIMRLYDRTYYPLNDSSSRICRRLVEYTEKMRSRYVKSLTNPNKKIIRMKRKVMLRFNKHYQKQPSKLSPDERKELFEFILKKTKFGKTLLEKKWRYLLPLLSLREIVHKFPEDMARICQLPLLNWTLIPEREVSSD